MRRICFADTLGVVDSFAVAERIGKLRSVTDLEIEMHAHDDLGLATTNTIAAARAAATHVNTTSTDSFPALSAKVAQASGRPVSWQKSLVGEGVFTREAGIHVEGLLKHPDNYQGFDP